MKRRDFFVTIFLLTILTLSALNPFISSLFPKKQSSEGIQRVILISIDACNPESISQMYMPFLYSRIIRDGIKFKFATSILAAETMSGHTTMLTGSYPTRTGIIANGMYFSEDWKDPLNNTLYPEGTFTAVFTDHRFIQTNTIIEQFANNNSIKTAFISGKWRLIPLLSQGADLIFGNANNGTYFIPEGYEMKVGAPPTYIEGDAVDIWSMNCLIEVIKNDPDTDFIFINLAYTNPLQHAYSPSNEVIVHQLRELDNLFQRLFNELETLGEYDSTLFVITADHGHDRADFLLNLFEVFDQSSNPHIEVDFLAESQAAFIFLENSLQLQEALELLETRDELALVVPRDNSSVIGYSNYSEYNLYPHYNRSGDIFISIKENGAMTTSPDVPFGLFGVHGGISTVDVPLAIFGKNINFKPELQGYEIINQVPNTVDILPTISSFMNWSLTQMTLDGTTLEIFE